MELNVTHLKGLIDIFTELEPERILKKAVVRISEILDAKGCSIFLYDEGCNCIELAETTGIVVKEKKHITYKEGEGLTGWVFKNRKPLLLQDFDIATLDELQNEFGDDFNWTGKYSEGEHRKPKSYLAVPITSKSGRFYGIIRTSSVTSNFTVTDQEILIHVADYISIALENSYHYVQERKKADYFELLMELGTRLHSHYNLKDLLDFVAEQSALTFSAETCEIYLRDNEYRNKLILRAGFGIPPDLINKAEHEVGEGLTGTLVKENRIIRLNNVLTFPKYKGKYRTQMKKNLRYGDRLAFLGIPISIKNEVIGALKLYNKIPRYEGGQSYFTEDDEKYLAVLGDLLSVAIENLQYLESMKTSAIQMFKTQRLTALGTMAIRLPNEITNPLTTAQLTLRNMRRKMEKTNGTIPPAQMEKYLTVMEERLSEVASGVKVLQEFSTKAGFLKVRKTWEEIIDEGLLFLSDEILRKKIAIHRNKEKENQLPQVTVEPNEMSEVVINLIIIAVAPLRNFQSNLYIETDYQPDNELIVISFRSVNNAAGPLFAQTIFRPEEDSEIVTPQQFMFNVAKEIIHNNYQGTINSKLHKDGIEITLTMPIGGSSV